MTGTNPLKLLLLLANVVVVVGIAHLFGAQRETIGPYTPAIVAAGLSMLFAEEILFERFTIKDAEDRKRRLRFNIIASIVAAVVAIGLYLYTRYG